jgi:hypothetical protein
MPISTIVIVAGSWLLLLGLAVAFSVATRDRTE